MSRKLPFFIRQNESFGVGLSIPSRGGSSRSARASQDNEEDAYFSFPRASEPDPWVQSAPLILAATCADGSVALVAVHTQPSSSSAAKTNPDDNDNKEERSIPVGELEEEEPFLYESAMTKHTQSIQRRRSNTTTTTTNDDDDDDDDWWMDGSNVQVLDLPRHFAGPTRIGNLGHEMAWMATGWRADCDTLTESAQRLVQQEHSLLASPVSGHVVASELSLWMAHRIVVQEQVRVFWGCCFLLALSRAAPAKWRSVV